MGYDAPTPIQALAIAPLLSSVSSIPDSSPSPKSAAYLSSASIPVRLPAS